MPNAKHEDALLKMGVKYFQEHILKLIGIDYTYEDILPTELIELTINELYMDFTFKTTEDLYIHIEFQSTNSSENKDLRRFHSYEALFSHNTGKKVITYVIYTGGIKKSKGKLDCGAYTYRVMPIYMGKKKAKDKIKEGILLLKQENNELSDKVTAILYTLADKFLTGEELNEVKEAVTMTRLGQMIMDDGIELGRKQGLALTEKLLSANRVEDCIRATKDEEYRKQLMKELGIK